MKRFELYNKKDFIKFAKTTLFAMSFLGTVTLTGCSDKGETKKETTSIETVAPTKKPTVVESTITYETERKPEETLVVETTMPETIEIPVIEPLPETTEQLSEEMQETLDEEYNFPSEPEKFNSAEELVIYVEKNTELLKQIIKDGNRKKYEDKLVSLSIKIGKFRVKKDNWNGINYSDLSEQQKKRYSTSYSVWWDWTKDNINDFGDSVKEASRQFYGEDADQVSENINDIKDSLGKLWDTTKQKGKENYEDIKQGEAYQNAEEKVKDGASKAKQKLKEYLK